MANEKIVNRENLKAFRKAFQEKLENGQIIPALSKNLDAVSEESGITQETPFILQGTGTANGTASVDTSPIGKQLEKQGNTVCVNQLISDSDINASSSQNGVDFTKNNNGTITINGTSTGVVDKGIISGLPIVSGHKYLLFSNIVGSSNNLSSGYTLYTHGTNVGSIVGNYKIGQAQANGTTTVYFKAQSGVTINQTIKVYIIDITQWFNDNIPQDLLDHPENAGRYGLLDVAFNTGTLVNANGRYLENGYRNLYDGENPIKAISNATYNIYGSATLTYKDLSGNTISSESKTNTTFVAPSNCDTIEVSGSGNITISLYYPTGEGYDKYYPYVEPKVYDTGTETLRSAGSVKDTKLPSGEIIRRLKEINATSLTWTYDSGLGCWESNVIPSIKSIANAGVKANIVSTYYTRTNRSNISSTPMGIAQNIANQLVVNNGSSTTKPTGYIYVELSTPTTEQGTPFVKEIEIDDYGTMGWKDTNNDYVDVPQGCKIFYPANVADFIDSIGQREDIGWDASEIVSQEQLGVESTARSNQDTILLNAIGGTLRQCLCAKVLSAGGTLLFNRTNIIDASELNWQYGSGFFYVPVGSLPSDFKQDATNGNNILCSKYQSSAKTDTEGNNLNIYGYCSYYTQYLFLKDSNYTDVLTLKQALKGVLLAYEKA